MNILIKILDEIKFTIPEAILRNTFKSDVNYNTRTAPFSIDYEIKNKVLGPRFFKDCDIVGGQEAIIDIGDIQPEFLDFFSMVYVIPSERLNYKSIMSVLSVGFMPYGNSLTSFSNTSYAVAPGGGMNDVSNAASLVMDSHGSIPDVSTARADLIGDNIIMIRSNQRVNSVYQVRCLLTNEAELQNFNPRYALRISDGAILCVKSYIYNKLRIDIDRGFLSGGQELGYIKEYVESLADAETMYREFMRTVMSQISLMNNSVEHQRFIKLQLGTI